MREKIKIENRLKQIAQEMLLCQQEYDAISQQINHTIQPGVTNRRTLYQSIRQQSVLLTRQQDIMQQLIDLQNSRSKEEQQLQQCRYALNQIDKRHHKTTFYLQKVRRELLRQADMGTENEIQEIVGYGGKNSGNISARRIES